MKALSMVARDFWTGKRGSVAIVFAVTLPILIGTAAFATDMGVLYLERRSLQAATDAAALAAATHPEKADRLVRQLLDASGNRAASFTLTLGTYRDDPAIDRDGRFVADPSGRTARVEASFEAELFLGRIFRGKNPRIEARTDATLAPMLSLSAGSRLASVDPPVVNGLLKSLLGVSLELKVADYKGLLHSRIALGTLLRGIADQGLDIDPNETRVGDVLSHPIRLSALLHLLSVELDRTGDPVGAAILRKAGFQTAPARAEIRLGDFVRLEDGLGRLALDYPGPALRADLSVLALLNAAMTSNGIGNVLTADLAVPGLASAKVEAMIGEAAKTSRALSVSHAPKVSTDQVRIRARLKTAGLLDALGTRLDVPIEVVVAGGTAEVASVTCSASPARREVKVRVQPGVAKLAIGKWSGPLADASVHDRLPAVDLASVLVATIQARGYVALRQVDPVIVTFRGAEIGNGTVKTVKTSTLAQSLFASLLEDTEIIVRVGQLGLPISGLTQGVATLLGGLTAPIDSLLDTVLAVAGVSIGEMDVRVDTLICQHAKIVG